MTKYKHLTFDERLMIQGMLNSKASFKAIGRKLGKDCTTISKEITGRLTFRRVGAQGVPFNDCRNRFGCKKGFSCVECSKSNCRYCATCSRYCSQYEQESCSKLEKPPYVCNGCSSKVSCSLEKREYHAVQAQKEYAYTLSDSRNGVSLTQRELQHIDDYVSPRIKAGQSLNHIMAHGRSELMVCEKTIRNYIHLGLLSVANIDLQKQVTYRPRRKDRSSIKVDKSCRKGRTYKDFQRFMDQHPQCHVVEMDTLEGTKGGACLLVIAFADAKYDYSMLRPRNNAASVAECIDWIYGKLGHEVFAQLFPVILLDNGSEFSDPISIEFKDGRRRTWVFYCDPASPEQKPHVENNNQLLRAIFPKGHSLDPYTQQDILLAINHINSEAKASINQRSAYEMFAFLYGEEPLKKLGAELIPPDQIVLLPKLLK